METALGERRKAQLKYRHPNFTTSSEEADHPRAGISTRSLREWVQADLARLATKEICHLTEEIGRLHRQQEILKKAAVILGATQKTTSPSATTGGAIADFHPVSSETHAFMDKPQKGIVKAAAPSGMR